MKKLTLLFCLAVSAFAQSQQFNELRTQWNAFGNNATINNSQPAGCPSSPPTGYGCGYVTIHGDSIVTNPANEMRGASIDMRRLNSGVNDSAYDTFGVAGIVEMLNMNFPNGLMTGQVKPLVSEAWFHSPAASYTASLLVGIQSNLEELEAGVTLTLHEGLVINPPIGSTVGGSSGTITNEVGIDIEDLAATTATITNMLGAIQIKGYGNAGKVVWTNGISIQEVGSAAGVGELDASTRWQTGSGVGFNVGGSGANAGMAAGSYAVGASTVIGGSFDAHFSTGAFSASVGITTTTNNVGYYLNGTGIIQYSTIGPTINIGNVYNINATNTITGVAVVASSNFYANGTPGVTASYCGAFTEGLCTTTGSAPGGVTSFNTRTGAVTLSNADVTGAVGQNLNTSGTPSWASATVTYLAFNSGNIDTSGDISTTGYIYTSGGYRAGGGNGVSCSAGTVNILTMVVSGGIVIHC
jgi:hypothetical protein